MNRIDTNTYSCLNKTYATIHSFMSVTNVDRFSKFFSLSYFPWNLQQNPSHFKDATPPCKTQKTETGKILLHVSFYWDTV